MSLQRKPQVGDRIAFARLDMQTGAFVEPTGAEGTVKRVIGALCYWLPDGAADLSCHQTVFIWQFNEGSITKPKLVLNKLARIMEAP